MVRVVLVVLEVIEVEVGKLVVVVVRLLNLGEDVISVMLYLKDLRQRLLI